MVFQYSGLLTKEDSDATSVLWIRANFEGVLTNPDPTVRAEATSAPGTTGASAAQSVGVTPRNDLPAGTRGYYRIFLHSGPTITYWYTY